MKRSKAPGANLEEELVWVGIIAVGLLVHVFLDVLLYQRPNHAAMLNSSL